MNPLFTFSYPAWVCSRDAKGSDYQMRHRVLDVSQIQALASPWYFNHFKYAVCESFAYTINGLEVETHSHFPMDKDVLEIDGQHIAFDHFRQEYQRLVRFWTAYKQSQIR